ncbi:helix-turn-helix domain-containing protein [Barnesiella intestinihominis]|jgi:transcriptional regulator with XRE-family HTH domain|uniref:helix-turn-helix domain-containing protein n=1 Tax=Barnesiella intestinihominis TaxID=487174 RepID=UPI003966F692
MFSERIKELRIRSRIPQRQLAAVLDIDTATYCKIEKGERKARREQVGVIAQILHADKNELVKLWLADKVYDIVSKESNAQDVLNMVNENIGKYGQSI